MDCNQCGGEISPDDAFCRTCGAELVGMEAPGGGMPSTPAPRPPTPSPPAALGRTSGLAIASLALGMLSFACLPVIGGVLALILGLIARGEVRRSAGSVRGRGMATAGLILGAINLVMFIILAAIAISWAILSVGATQTQNLNVAPLGAKKVIAELDIRQGSLDVEGGAGDLFEGSFTYNVKQWVPQIDYHVDDSQGYLRVTQGSGRFQGLWNARNTWLLKFNDGIPLDLTANLAGTDGRFILSSLSLGSLVINSSSGDVRADLSGVEPALAQVKIASGDGDVDLAMQGTYETYIELDVENGKGDVSVDLRGQWHGTLGAHISNGSGYTRLHLPSDVGVRVRVKTSSGDINAGGMKLESEDGGSLYVNDAFGNSPVTLQIDLETSSGDASLVVGN